jgi:hypothetical protein
MDSMMHPQAAPALKWLKGRYPETDSAEEIAASLDDDQHDAKKVLSGLEALERDSLVVKISDGSWAATYKGMATKL